MLVPTNRAAEVILAYAARKTRKDLLASLGMAESTFVSRLKNPGSFRLDELTALQRCLRMPDEIILEIIKSID